ncbi:MAG: hypothetical protein RDU25_01070 [Patescibacteria group bacterium]|nr:hypothetical protein [Patescibacteria group bacterium]
MTQNVDPRSRRFSRYHCSSNTPPALEAILRSLGKLSRSRGGIANRQAVRSLAQRADPHYHDKGKSDDLCRFLINTSVLLETTAGSRLYYDETRAAHVFACCQEGREPDQAADAEERLREIMCANSAPDESVSGPATGRSVSAAPPTQSTVDVQRSETDAPHALHVIFLTPIEYDLWVCIQSMATDDSGRYTVQIPSAVDRLYHEWASSQLKCTPDEYAAGLAIYISKGLLKRLDGSEEYVFMQDPTTIHAVEVPERPVKQVSRQDLDAVSALEHEFRLRQDVALGQSLADALDGIVPPDKMQSAYTKFVGGPNTITHKYSYWGIIWRQPTEGSHETYVCLPGFERFTLELKEPIQDTAQADPLQSSTMPSPAPDPDDDFVGPPSERRVIITPPPAGSFPALEASSPADASAAEDEQKRRRIEAMEDDELQRKLEEWRRMLETLPHSILLAEDELRNRARARKRNQLAARLETLRAEQQRLENEARDKAAEAERLAADLAALDR